MYVCIYIYIYIYMCRWGTTTRSSRTRDRDHLMAIAALLVEEAGCFGLISTVDSSSDEDRPFLADE